MKVPVGGNEAQVRLSIISYLTQKKRSRIENVVFFLLPSYNKTVDKALNRLEWQSPENETTN